MWQVFEESNGTRTLFATCWSESMAWLLCKENNSIAKAARGIRFTYQAA